MTVTFSRLAGTDRTKTAATISRNAATTATGTTAVLVGYDAGADALSAAYLAGRLKATVLLTATLTLSNATATALTRLGVTSVHLIGGTDKISQNVEDLLGWSYGADNVIRHAGTDRIATNLAVLAAGAAITKPTEAFICRAYGSINDGVAAGPIAYANGVPVILLDSTLPSGWASTVKAAGITKLTILGSDAAVPTAVETALKAAGFTLGTRLGGTDSRATAALIANAALTSYGFSTANVGLARGDVPADALAAAPYAGGLKAPVLLTESTTVLGSAAGGFLTQHRATLTTGTVFGSSAAVSDAVVTAAVAAAA
ncbi:cell wall-binding repeat-containing protein [Kineococcus rhizosphaerae]|uniref:Putative cell wall binding repeat protein n=1 Tax=Kineococcus rhizosphaerae TaxID=559628 RepID=A0A2T0QPC9_9ACTN|nr:cell wall-binding repeat-containing protein [Kineococcus rhizosphaerae]PRY06454.1 putative cell wall binding repeat protein [Kineococcus rhizosphaerae]